LGRRPGIVEKRKKQAWKNLEEDFPIGKGKKKKRVNGMVPPLVGGGKGREGGREQKR